MGKMKEVWVADDGTEFDHEYQMLDWERKCAFCAWYDDGNQLCDEDDTVVTGRLIYEWLYNHKRGALYALGQGDAPYPESFSEPGAEEVGPAEG